MPKAFKQIAPPVPNRHHAKNAIIMVAIYELVKGLVALGVAAIIFVGHDKLQWIARVVAQALHRIMGMALHHQIEALNHYAWVANQNWQKAFWIVVGYALLRFVETYGLYRDKIWAYWYSVLGYGVFLPLEVYELLSHRFNWLNFLILLINIVIVVVVYRNMHAKGLLGKKMTQA